MRQLALPGTNRVRRAARSSLQAVYALDRYESLPRLAVVMTTTKDYVNPDRLARAHNVESWAIRHGYLFYNNVIETQDYRSVGEPLFFVLSKPLMQASDPGRRALSNLAPQAVGVCTCTSLWT